MLSWLSLIILLKCYVNGSTGNYILVNTDPEQVLTNNEIKALESGSRLTDDLQIETQLEASAQRFVQYQPRYVHMSFGNSPIEMVITWSTIDKTSAVVEYGIKNFTEKSSLGSSTFFQAPGHLNRTQYIHRVTLKKLIPGKKYHYHCGSDLGWSDLFFFTTMRAGTDWSPQFAIFGDLGNVNAKSLTRLQREVQLNYYSAIIHVGDFAYDLNHEDGQVGDSFMEQIQPIASSVPYMTCPGNHEHADNFLHYKKRFTMPGTSESMFYSWNIGPIHFISISTEFYYYLQYGIKPLIDQYQWLQNNLLKATKQKNRAKRPWIIVYGHRPMYCSNQGNDDCTKVETLTRVGIPPNHSFGLENLFMDNGVDLLIWAHEHSYERMWPMYDREVFNGSLKEPYTNPRALVHITTGSAGCRERHARFKPEKPDWSAFRSIDYGYTRVQALNKTHLYVEQVSDDKDGKVIDSFTIIRHKHESYPIPSP